MAVGRMNRRALVAALSSAAAWPLAARGQQSERVRRVGVLLSTGSEVLGFQPRLAALMEGLVALGWSEGRNLHLDIREAKGNADDGRKYAAELVALAPDVILVVGGASLGPLLHATRAIPVVFLQVPDPVGSGFIESLARPGGNATGFISLELGLSGKWLELLKEVAPHVTRAGVLRDSAIGAGIGQLGAIQAVAPSLGVEINPVNVREASGIERAIDACGARPNGGLIVTGSALAQVHS